MDLRERSANPNRHPWELSRADMALELLSGNPRGTRYADVGSGDLYFSRRLRGLTDARVHAVDVNYGQAGVEEGLVICTDLNQVPSGTVDCAVLMDVLEHVDDDVGMLRAVGRVLSPAGQLLITVPAHAFLWSEHDVFLGHRRRYSRQLLSDVLRRGGLDIIECFHFYCIPLLLRAVTVAAAAVGARKGHSTTVSLWPYPGEHPLTKTARAALNCDFRLSRLLERTPLPGCGLSICALCRSTPA